MYFHQNYGINWFLERRVKNKEMGVCDKEKELKMDTSSCSTMEDELIVLKIEAKKWPLIMVFKGMTVNSQSNFKKSNNYYYVDFGNFERVYKDR